MTSPRAKTAAGPIPVDVVRHDDKRANIPTDELRDFVEVEEQAPDEALYPRDPSLDPQLVWKGKAEQDAADLAVPTVPIYIQEKVQPRVIVENLRDTAGPGEVEPELTLFDDFNGIEFEQLVDFYQHEQNWTNRLILGDSLLVMNSLAEKEGLKGKVQTIYFDPPYGIRFGSNWQVSTRKRDVRDGKVEDATRQPEQIRAFRDTWELGIHSYLAYLRDRVAVARELLTDSGSVFVQIGDENVHLVRSVLDEIFGSENFVSQITFKKTSGAGSPSGGTNTLPTVSDYLVWYAKDREVVKYRPLYRDRELGGAGAGQYTWIEDPDGTRRRATADELVNATAETRLLRPGPLTSQTVREAQTTVFDVELDGDVYRPGKGGWKTNREGMARLKAAGRLMGVGKTLCFVRYFDDFPLFPLTNLWDDTTTSGFADPKTYVVQTNAKVVERCLLMTSDPGDLVLDPTCGSGTTAYASEKWGRRWITIDTSRVAVALARPRLMSARLPSYLLTDTPEGQRKEKALTGRPASDAHPRRDIRKGFVNRRVAHVTLGGIARNGEISEGMAPEDLASAILRDAEPREVVDQPYENAKAVRVTGPFTVESLSPHRMLEFGERPAAEETQETDAPFAMTVLDNLRKAGVQNTVRQEHLDFTTLDPFAGTLVHARGEFVDADGTSRTVAVCVGPEHGTVGADAVKDAAKEALKGVGFDLLLVCAFAFDAHAGETAKEFRPDEASGWAVAAEEKRFGKLPVLLVRMNPDLAMGDELLKKTGTGNLFMVFGEPDVVIERTAADHLEVEIRGVDVYDPTTGQVRSSSVDDIACWFIDTNYNGESFFVRHAYFTGAADPYRSLQRALKADIDGDAWASLYRTRSRPFAVPATRRIAVKVINHYGDEVLKTYDV